jgi:thioredoxin 1
LEFHFRREDPRRTGAGAKEDSQTVVQRLTAVGRSRVRNTHGGREGGKGEVTLAAGQVRSFAGIGFRGSVARKSRPRTKDAKRQLYEISDEPIDVRKLECRPGGAADPAEPGLPTRRTMNGNVIELNAANFAREVLAARNPVLVEFWAEWSEPCRAITPLLESVADGEAVPVKVGRVNVEQHVALAEEYGVRAVPTLLIFNRGGLRDEIVGRTSARELREKLEQFA